MWMRDSALASQTGKTVPSVNEAAAFGCQLFVLSPGISSTFTAIAVATRRWFSSTRHVPPCLSRYLVTPRINGAAQLKKEVKFPHWQGLAVGVNWIT
jgi:hypothetical protein